MNSDGYYHARIANPLVTSDQWKAVTSRRSDDDTIGRVVRDSRSQLDSFGDNSSAERDHGDFGIGLNLGQP